MNEVIRPISLDEWFKEQEKQQNKENDNMTKVRVFDIEDGNILMSYKAKVIPQVGDGMFIEDVQVRIVDIHHILKTIGNDMNDELMFELESVEIEVEVIV